MRLKTFCDGDYEEAPMWLIFAPSTSRKKAFHDTATDCPICMEAMDTTATVVTLKPCGHKMHATCALNMALKKRKCAVCRSKIVSAD
jgi:hypothetical protein